MSTSDMLNQMFAAHGVEAHVSNTIVGPTITRHEITLGPAVTVERVLRLQRTIALTVGTQDVRIIAPVNGRPVMGIELPSAKRGVVRLADVFLAGAHPLTIPLGVDVDGTMQTACLATLPHLLVAGTTGGGKSNFVNAALTTIIGRTTPAVVRMLMIDLKKVELTPYADAPHLLCPVITEAPAALRALRAMIEIADDRYRMMERVGVRDLDAYNEAVIAGRAGEDAEILPYHLIVIDELAELLMVGRSDVEDVIARIGQIGRAAGIHLFTATQSPRYDVVTGKIKVNIPARVAFFVPKSSDSRIVLDQGGAEKLLGKGDGLYTPGGPKLTRFQGVLCTTEEVNREVELAAWAWQAEVAKAQQETRPSPPPLPRRPAWVDQARPRPAAPAPVSVISGTVPAVSYAPPLPYLPPAPVRAKRPSRWGRLIGKSVAGIVGLSLATALGAAIVTSAVHVAQTPAAAPPAATAEQTAMGTNWVADQSVNAGSTAAGTGTDSAAPDPSTPSTTTSSTGRKTKTSSGASPLTKIAAVHGVTQHIHPHVRIPRRRF